MTADNALAHGSATGLEPAAGELDDAGMAELGNPEVARVVGAWALEQK